MHAQGAYTPLRTLPMRLTAFGLAGMRSGAGAHAWLACAGASACRRAGRGRGVRAGSAGRSPGRVGAGAGQGAGLSCSPPSPKHGGVLPTGLRAPEFGRTCTLGWRWPGGLEAQARRGAGDARHGCPSRRGRSPVSPAASTQTSWRCGVRGRRGRCAGSTGRTRHTRRLSPWRGSSVVLGAEGGVGAGAGFVACVAHGEGGRVWGGALAVGAGGHGGAPAGGAFAAGGLGLGRCRHDVGLRRAGRSWVRFGSAPSVRRP